MSKQKSQLRGGLVPAGEKCPYAAGCPWEDICPTTKPGGNEVDYSCALARALDLCPRDTIPE